MKFRDIISNIDPSITNIPSGYSRYGHIMLLRSSSKLPSKMAEIILSHYPWCQSVYQQTDTKGISRIPEIKLLLPFIESELKIMHSSILLRNSGAKVFLSAL